MEKVIHTKPLLLHSTSMVQVHVLRCQACEQMLADSLLKLGLGRAAVEHQKSVHSVTSRTSRESSCPKWLAVMPGATWQPYEEADTFTDAHIHRHSKWARYLVPSTSACMMTSWLGTLTPAEAEGRLWPAMWWISHLECITGTVGHTWSSHGFWTSRSFRDVKIIQFLQYATPMIPPYRIQLSPFLSSNTFIFPWLGHHCPRFWVNLPFHRSTNLVVVGFATIFLLHRGTDMVLLRRGSKWPGWKTAIQGANDRETSRHGSLPVNPLGMAIETMAKLADIWKYSWTLGSIK